MWNILNKKNIQQQILLTIKEKQWKYVVNSIRKDGVWNKKTKLMHAGI